MHQQSPSHRFPALLWDSLPHGGASQVHPHIHATVHSEQYYGMKNIHLSLSLFDPLFLFRTFRIDSICIRTILS